MMAKMFYTLDETKAALGKNEEEIKQFAREGRLREFRDGPRLMFKADQVEALKGELGLGGAPAPDMGPSDSGGPIGLVDSRTASATGISLLDTDAAGRSGTGQTMQLQEDTALGLSGSIGGVPSPGRSSPSSTGSLAGTRGGSGAGVNVLGDSVGAADPSAQTAISGGGVSDQVSLEGVGSGSGLLDLTRESDDTSLGAELLDEIAPGGSGSKRGTKAGTGAVGGSGIGSGVAAGSAVGGSVPGVAVVRGRAVGTPVFVEAADPMAPLLGGMALGAALMVLFGGLAVMSAVLETSPEPLAWFDFAAHAFLITAGIGIGVSLLFGAIGMVLGRAVR
jgi:hypothetical protein